MIRKIAFAALAAACALGSMDASAASLGGLARSLQTSKSASFLTTRSPTLAPFSHVRFCVKNPGDCRADSGESIVDLNGTTRAQLQQINRQINGAIRPVNDNGGALGDEWRADVSSGDCEDFVLTKRRKLVALGWPSRTLRIAVARTQAGEGHAVLVVKTSEGDLVLDNRTNKIKTWNRSNLQWVKIQSGDNPRLWFDL